MSKERHGKRFSAGTKEGIRALSPIEQYQKTLDMVSFVKQQLQEGNTVATVGMNALIQKMSDALPEYNHLFVNDLGKKIVLAVLEENLKHEGRVLHAKGKKDRPEPKNWQNMKSEYIRGLIYGFNLDGTLRTFLPVSKEEGMSREGVSEYLRRGERRVIYATRAFLFHQSKK